MSRQEYDYIVVGGGSAGCVVATRLIEHNAGTVLLLEAGGPDSSLFHTIPATVVKVFQQKSWPYMTIPQPHCNGREMIIAQGKVLGNPVLKGIGEKYGKNEVQVSLRWLVQQDSVMAIPRTSKTERLKDNLNIFDFELSAEDVAQIDQLKKDNQRVVNPSFAPDWDTVS